MSGHVFVIQGDIRQLRCDARLLPARFGKSIPNETKWLHETELELPPEDPPPGWASGETRTFWWGAAKDGPDLWLSQVGLSTGQNLDWALGTVRQWLPRALDRIKSIGRRVPDRAVPLLAMHLVASGVKNAAPTMGDLVHRVLAVVEDFVERHEVDVAIVADGRTQYNALQAARRQNRRPTALSPRLEGVVGKLAEHARAGHLCLLTGAGISMGAGLPSWSGLLKQLAHDCRLDESQLAQLWKCENPLVQAQKLAEHFAQFHEHVAAKCDAQRIALTHGILASMRLNEVVTLNYDTLFQVAAQSVRRGCKTCRACKACKDYEACEDCRNCDRCGPGYDVIPHGRRGTGPAWLLKLHGCRTRPKEIVLTTADYERFEEHCLALRGIVQTLLITRHMLVVGFGMSDPNVHTIIEVVKKAAANDDSAQGRTLGTILRLDGNGSEPLAPQYESFDVVQVRSESHPDEFPAHARLLEIVLDRLALEGTDACHYLLDGRFDGLLGEQGVAVRKAAERFAEELSKLGPDTPAAERILKQLHDMGLPRG